MVLLVSVATCSLNQWALDFAGNARRIAESVRLAKAAGARYRVGPELEVTGYGCEDHFLESDTYTHAWDALAGLLADEQLTRGILCDVGMPVFHDGVRYNCRVFILDQRILLVRPKICLADDGNYRESRYFAAWVKPFGSPLERLALPECVRAVCGQAAAPFGVALVRTRDARIAAESCEELFAPQSPHTAFALAGADIISNGSGSHHQLRKLNTRVDLMRGCTAKEGGVYMYANQQGCDGGRLYYDGCAAVFVNGECVAQGSQFSLADVECCVATVDLDDVRSYRAASVSRQVQAAHLAASLAPPSVEAEIFLAADQSTAGARLRAAPSPPRPVNYHSPEEEIGLGPACWLWDYLRRSGGSGFFLPLSGGADSAATCAIVNVMCDLLFEECGGAGSEAAAAAAAPAGPGPELSRVHAGGAGSASCAALVLADLRRVVGDAAYVPPSRADIAHRIMHTCYMATSNSGSATTRRAEALAAQVGTYHTHVNIDAAVAAVVGIFTLLSGQLTGEARAPRFESRGGSKTEDLALQNIQARLRMVVAYMLAQLLPWMRGRRGGWLLVLGSANVDEALRGYMTKYDCSSADVNPIGAISKRDLASFLRFCAARYGLPALSDIEAAPPTAELRPNVEVAAAGAPAASAASSAAGGATAAADAAAGESQQKDEDEMGMTYEELGHFGRLRKVQRCGPLSMYLKLLHVQAPPWRGLRPAEVAAKVRRFFYFYAVNRHKMTTLTPSYHAESYSPDDNRYDLRPFLYNVAWDAQFAAIARDVEARDRDAAAEAAAGGAADGARATGVLRAWH